MRTFFLRFSLFFQKNTGATDISLTPAKHLCHIINSSQSSLCYTKDTSSSVLISVSDSVFLLHWQRLHWDCSSGVPWYVHANYVILMHSSWLPFIFVLLGSECKSSSLSVPLIRFISFCSNQQTGLLSWHKMYILPEWQQLRVLSHIITLSTLEI